MAVVTSARAMMVHVGSDLGGKGAERPTRPAVMPADILRSTQLRRSVMSSSTSIYPNKPIELVVVVALEAMVVL